MESSLKANNNIIKIVSLFIFLLLAQPSLGFSQSEQPNTLKLKIRGLVSQYLGEETASKYFGESPDAVTLPKIPKLVCDSKTTNCGKGGITINEEKLSIEQRQKYNNSFLSELHQVTRNRNANKNFLMKWMNVMDQGASREGVYRAMVLDGTYAGLENLEDPINDGTIQFAIDYFKTYLGKRVKPNSFEQMNFYSLKRIITERSLELLDELSKKPDDLNRWYAIFSMDLAKKYPQLWQKNKVRQNQSSLFHLSWAAKAPSQHLRSEVIIKLHSVVNHLSR